MSSEAIREEDGSSRPWKDSVGEERKDGGDRLAALDEISEFGYTASPLFPGNQEENR